MDNKTFFKYLFIVVLVGISFRLWNFTPTLGNDDQRWVLSSQEVGAPRTADLHPVYYGRILYRSLLAIWGQLAGLSLTTTPWLMFGLSCLTTWMIALAGRLAFSPSVGLWAAFVYATHPIAVVYDVLTLPDGLGQALLASSMFLIVKFLRTDRIVWLMICGVVIGLSYFTKNYFILTAIPIVLCLSLKATSLRIAISRTILFSSMVVAGFVIGAGISWWDSGDPYGMFRGMSDYAQRLQKLDQGNENVGFQRLARATMQRIHYLEYLFLDMGVVTGFLTLWACALVFIESRKNTFCLLLSIMISMFLIFLLFFPAKLRPFIFVEMQPRYLGVLIPMIAIGAGLSISAIIERLPVPLVRRAFLIILISALASNVVVPNDLNNKTFNRSSRMEFDGIRHLLKHAEDKGISEFIFPDSGYRQITPDSFYSIGPTLSFYDANDAVLSGEARDRLLNSDSVVIFLPRNGFNWPLVQALRRGEYRYQLEFGESHRPLVDWLEREGFSKKGMSVPDTVFMAWMSWAGLVGREQQLVGWTYRRKKGPLNKNAPAE